MEPIKRLLERDYQTSYDIKRLHLFTGSLGVHLKGITSVMVYDTEIMIYTTDGVIIVKREQIVFEFIMDDELTIKTK